jgi:intracellular sulfur oxidation DsrE/DsrF family protein
MERIVIEVDDATAKKWRKTSPQIKNKLEKLFEKQIEIVAERDKETQFEELLDKARREAAKNGLTEDILEQLLNEK